MASHLLSPSLADAQTAAAPSARAIDLNEFRVEGNTVLPPRDIEAALYGFLGPNRSVQDVEHARAALEDLYTKRGYPTVSATVPPQDGADGIVVIQVLERPVGRLRVVGSHFVAPSAITQSAPSLTPGVVPRMADVQRDLLLLNQLPDRTITPAMRPGHAADTVDVDLAVDDHLPLSASLELNNRRSPDTTALRAVGSLSYDNLWQRGDGVTLGFQVAPQRPNDAKVASASYLYRLPDSRLSLQASYLRSDSNVSTLGGTSVVGRGTIEGLRLIAPFDGSEGFAHSLSAGFDYKDLTQQVGVGGQFTNSPITYVPFSATYLAGWNTGGSSTDVSSTLVWAFRGIGGNFAEFDNKRLNAQGNFAYLKADFSHTHTLPYDIQIYAHGLVQVSPVPLVSSEQLSLGGLDTVRGYLEGESLGDYGGSGQLELRTPPLARLLGRPVTTLRMLAFVDAGAAKIHLPQSGQQAASTLASAGVGASVRLFDAVGGEIDDAQVLLPGPATRGGANRVLFRIFGDF
jgi:hemolysin activation/secretion protein